MEANFQRREEAACFNLRTEGDLFVVESRDPEEDPLPYWVVRAVCSMCTETEVSREDKDSTWC
jgi:hypothetical protein